uniref:NlpC/P60 domain-containing protein n=1 Tax=viral metagenome TaxID=1070528 RepID=A0A6M3JDZ5_9ZZZZ
MKHWSNDYVGRKLFFDEEGYKGHKMCLLLALEILSDKLNFNVFNETKRLIKETEEEWYKEAPYLLVLQSYCYGKTLSRVDELKEFDLVFFKIDNAIKHCGVMIDNYGKFIHQLKDRPVQIDRIRSKHWSKRFFCGLRVK